MAKFIQAGSVETASLFVIFHEFLQLLIGLAILNIHF